MKKYSRADVEAMKVNDIRGLIREHNLHINYIKNYSRMKKSDLVTAFIKHYKKRTKKVTVDADKTPTASPSTPKKQKTANKPEALPPPPPEKPKTKRRIAPTLISTAPASGTPILKEQSSDRRFKANYLDDLEKRAKSMDTSAKGKKLISKKKVAKSKEPKTQNNYRTGRNYA